MYHIYNRGTDKRKVFCNDNDYLRFIYSLSKFNCKNLSLHLTREIPRQDGRGFASTILDKLVKILYFVLMPTHFHLILQQITDRGIEKFMQKLGTGYTMYFNKKYQRSGVLFQGIFKAIPIETDSYITQVSQYIHLNPLKLIEPQFREKGLEGLGRAKKFLRNYRWSSYLDYVGVRNFPFLIDNKLHEGYFKDAAEYEEFVLSGIRNKMVEVSPRPSQPVILS